MVQKTFKADKNVLHEVISFVEEELENHDCNMKTQMMISVMVEEIFVNIASYAYKEKEGVADIILDFAGDDVKITFIDSGVEFNPLAKEDPDITLSAEERNIGGLGIYMVKQTMDEVIYERKNNQNILSIKKMIH